ncbi:MAG: hypothetical protein A2X31_09850 [Elusimicrobia bacterium GWB2_63_22]|nr:MAG: hypothetical protein A2X31_09850 [Elusimicrobia bacterium GWB2_63_22]
MKRLLILTLLALPAAAGAQELNEADLDAVPAQKTEEPAGATLKRPDSPAILAELSTALRLSSKQEERISAAVEKKTKEFDKLMKEYEKNLAEEKKWLYRTNESRHGMVKINRGMPDLVREFLDDEQRDSFDRLLEAKRKPAPAVAEAAPAPAAGKPVRKRRLVRRKKVAGRAPAAAAAPAAPAPEEPGQVLVDKDSSAVPPAPPKKKRVLKKRPITKSEPPASEYSEELQGSKPGDEEPEPDEADAGSYP